ncbi:MAG: hypothetical protein ACW99G_23025 [Candidatus Thorarchaeota archaeon]|jgi:hypothetical protein
MVGKKERKLLEGFLAWLKLTIFVLDVFPGRKERKKKREKREREEIVIK